MDLNQTNIAAIFPDDEFPSDISAIPAEIGEPDYASMGFGPDGFDGWAA